MQDKANFVELMLPVVKEIYQSYLEGTLRGPEEDDEDDDS